MKKFKYLLLMLLAIPFVVNAAETSSNTTYDACMGFADRFKTITGTYDYKYCYRAGCSAQTNGTWNIANMASYSGYSCTNGNTDPYKTWASDGCSTYKGSCTVHPAIYCTRIRRINCDLKSDGSKYVKGGGDNPSPTQPTNPAPTNPTNPTKPTPTKTKKTVSRPTGSKVIITTTEATSKGDNTRPVITEETQPTEPPKSSNVNITKILINGTDLKYHNEYNEYNIKVKKGVKDLEVVVETEDPNSQVSIEGAHNMTDEDSTIKIIVEAENGDTKTVIINVKRYEGESNDCNIANIAITDYEISHFDKNNYDYQLSIKGKTKSLNLEIIPSDPLHADYEVIGNQNLENNSMVTIQVKAEDGTMCYYNIKVKKMSGFWKVLFLIIIITIVLLLIVYFVYRYLKRSKNQYEYE